MVSLKWMRELRHELHTLAEISGQEARTAEKIAQCLQQFRPDKLLVNVGGKGVVAIYRGAAAGPSIGFRAELDALPIYELSDIPYRSHNDGVSHLCGHDGHMSMLMGMAEELDKMRPNSGSVALIFQPAEETGQGAESLRQDAKFRKLGLEYIFSLHNVPGLEIGKILLPETKANCASRGVKIMLSGEESHAAAPQDGVSPMQTVSRLMPALAGLAKSTGGVQSEEFSLVTVTHATLGKPSFGIAPGYAEIWATLRSGSNDVMESLCKSVEDLANSAAFEAGLKLESSYHEIFDACENHPQAVDIVKNSMTSSQITYEVSSQPQLWSEDFGRFSENARTAMFWLGSGPNQPQLHTPTYDFPDEILPIGTAAFLSIMHSMLD